MLANTLGHLLDRLQSTSHGPFQPAVQESAGPIWGGIFPEQLEALHQKVATYAHQVVLQYVAELGPLFIGKVFFPFQQAPASIL